jgi:hypothetical protein
VTINNTLFGIPELNALISNPSPTVLELVSPPLTHHPSGAGKTSLLYLIIAQAILPATFSSITDLGGRDAAIILFDPLHHFSVPRLASVLLSLITRKLPHPHDQLEESSKPNLLSLVQKSLDHVHIFRPQSWSSLLATLHWLPDYLFNASSHKSTHRRIHSLILKDTDAFLPSLRNTHPSPSTTVNPLSIASKSLTSSLQALQTLLSCSIILSSPSLLPTVFRPAIPVAWPQGMSVTRLAVRRVDVLKFAPEMGVEQAEAEKEQRWEVVRRGRFECWKVGGVKEEEGFVFRVGRDGVEVEVEVEKEG